MITAEAFYQLYDQLPPLMKRLLNRRELQQVNREIMDEHDLPDDRRHQLAKLIGAAMVKDFPLTQLINRLETEGRFSNDIARDLAREYLGRFFLPMQWYLGNIETLIQGLGGDVQHYLAEAKKLYPEVYAPETVKPVAPTTAPVITSASSSEHPILRDIAEHLKTTKGRAEVLLRLTGLSAEVEEAVKAKRITGEVGDELIHSLEAVSYAVNTQDLNALEVAAIKRRIASLLKKLGTA